jgi:hypothetical protein
MSFLRDIIPVVVWIFLMWLGLKAIEERDMHFLILYVGAGATGVTAFIAWLLHPKKSK